MTCFTSAMAALEMVGLRVMARRGIIIRDNAFGHCYTMYIRDKLLWSFIFFKREYRGFPFRGRIGLEWSLIPFCFLHV